MRCCVRFGCGRRCARAAVNDDREEGAFTTFALRAGIFTLDLSRFMGTSLAMLALERDGNQCVVGGNCRGRLEVHHRVTLAEGGDPFELVELVTLCSRHHRLVEAGSLAV
jgi:hypothetical protein